MSVRGRDLSQITINATRPARPPGLRVPTTGDKAVDTFFGQIAQHISLREGASNPFEKTVLHRDLVNLGLATNRQVTNPPAAPPPVPQTPGVTTSSGYMGFDDFAEQLRSTKLFTDLFTSLNDPNRFNGLPDKVKQELQADIAKIDGKVSAFVTHTQESSANAQQSFAQEVTAIRASVAQAAAGVQQVKYASANANRATAGIVTEVTARLDNFDGGGATVEESMSAVADRATGLEAQWTMKVNAGGAFAGIGLAASSPTAGGATSSIIMVANKFAFVQPTDVLGTGVGQVDPTNPGASRIPFGIDSDSTIYLNGTVRINANGTSLNDLAATTGIYVTFTSEFWKVDALGAAVNSTITLTANFTAGLSGTVTWTKSGAGSAPPTAGTSNTYTLNAADQTDDACTYTASYTTGGVTYTDSVTIVRLRDGSTALTGMLTNESHTVPASVTGVVSDYTGAGGTFRVFQGTTDITTSCSFAIHTNSDSLTANIGAATGIYSVTASGSWSNGSNTTTLTFRATYGSTTIDKVFTLTKAVTGATGAGGANAQLLDLTSDGIAFVFRDASATSSSGPTITFTANLQNVVGTATFTATAYNAAGASLGSITLGGSGNSRTLTAAQFVSLGATTTRTVVVTASLSGLTDTITIYRGDGGSDAMTGVLSNEACTVPADSGGTVSSFAGASTTVKVYRGITDDTTNWTFSRSDSGITTTINGGAGPVSGTASVTVTATAMSADSGTCTITASRTGYANITKVFSVAKSKAGTAGANGTNGVDGARGSIAGYGTKYALYLSGVSDTADPWPSTSTDAYRANRTIYNLLSGTSLTSDLTTTGHLRIGDEVTLTNNPPTAAETRFWTGTAWAKPGVVLNGNLLVKGTVAADQINVNGTSGIALVSGSNVGKIKLDSSGNILITSDVANKSIGFSGPNGGAVRLTDNSSGTATISSIEFATPGSTQVAAYIAHSRASPYFLGGGQMEITSGYRDGMYIRVGEDTGGGFGSLSSYGTLTVDAAAIAFANAKLSINSHMTVDENAKYQYSVDGGSTWTNITLRRHNW